jgi:hypothetical protein
MIEDERREVVEFLETEFLQKLLKQLEPKEVAFLYKYIDNNNNALQTAKDLEVNEAKIRRTLKHIQDKARELLAEMKMTKQEDFHYRENGADKVVTIIREIPVSYEDAKECFRPTVNLNFTQSAMSVGYPSETYMNLPKDRKWQIKFGEKRFPVNKTCMIPEYLEMTNCKCVCNICNENFKCTRKDAYPSNAEPMAMKINALKIEECIANLQANYKPEDLVGLERISF